MKWKNLNSFKLDTLEGKSPYEILRVDESASMEEVRKSYKNLVRAYHPDVADKFLKKHNEDIIKIVNVAYETILRERNEQR